MAIPHVIFCDSMSFLESSSDCFVVYIFSARARCPGLGRESDTICVASTLLMLFSSRSALAYFLNERQAQDFADKLAEVSPVAQNGAASSMFALLVGAAGYAGHYLEHGKKSPNAYLRLDPSKGANDNVLELVVREHPISTSAYFKWLTCVVGSHQSQTTPFIILMSYI